jgi:hypothetical protein
MGTITLKQANHFRLVHEVAWVEGNAFLYKASDSPADYDSLSLAWMEMRTTLAKLHFMFDLDPVKPDLDWHEESRMYTLWQKPALPVRVLLAKDSTSKSVA